jgi:tetratricopeptide (TPR) repeat protein
LIYFTSFSGCAIAKLNHHEEAPKAYDKAIELKSDDPVVCYNEGIDHYNLGRYEEALKAYDNATELKPYFPEAWIMKPMVSGGQVQAA